MKIYNYIKSIFQNTDKLNESSTYSDEDHGFRSLKNQNSKGINRVSRDEQLRMVFSLWLQNGFAKRIIELGTEFIFGEEFYSPTLRSKKNLVKSDTLIQLETIISDFIKSNKFNLKFEKFYNDLSLNGMLICPITTNPINGKVKIGFIDPSKLDTVKTDPYDITTIEQIEMKNDFRGEKKIFEIVKLTTDQGLKTLNGECFFYSINNVSNQPEGVSDLLANIEFIELLTELLTNVVDAVRLQSLFMIDVEINGMSDKEAKKWIKENPLPRKPSRIIHNQQIKQTMLSPGISGTDYSESVRLCKNFILGNYSYPAMWFADGTDANRAIAVEQGTPIFKKIAKRQEFIIEILKEIYTFVVHQAVLKMEGINLSDDQLNDLEIEIVAPAIDTKNVTTITTALTQLTDSLTKAESSKWITNETARTSYLTLLNSLGLNISIDSEIDELKKTFDDNENSKLSIIKNINNQTG